MSNPSQTRPPSLASSRPAALKDVNDREVGLAPAREWTRSVADASMFGPWSIKVVNELDRCSKDAQDMLLTCPDRMRPGHAFLRGRGT
jgi:hypothetical protein